MSTATTPGGDAHVLAALVSQTETQLAYLDPSFVFVEVNEAYGRGCGLTVWH